MKLLVVGSGGREHAIAKKLLASKGVDQVFVAPGNDGMTLDGLGLVNIGISEHSRLIDFAKENEIAWTFIGPDDALAAGIVDDFNSAGLRAFGPTKAAAELEWSKDFAKEIMVKYNVPTAAYGTFSDFEKAKAYIEEQGAPIVVKADGLALGKGVVVAETVEQAVEAAQEMLLDNKFGDSGARVVIEEFLDGEEFSSLPLLMAISSTSCRQLRITSVPLTETRGQILVVWVPMRLFLTCLRAWWIQQLRRSLNLSWRV